MKDVLKWVELAIDASNEFGVDASLILALIEQESSGNQFAWRYEPAFYERYMADLSVDRLSGSTQFKFWLQKNDEFIEQEKRARSTSFGLMQMMGETARWFTNTDMRYIGEYLMCPRRNVMTCTKFYKHLLDKTGSTELALKRYNGSSKYPPQVLAKQQKYKSIF